MNRCTFRLMYQTVYVTLGVIAFLASLGLFRYDYYDNWYSQFTNISNYLCLGIMTAELIQTVKHPNERYNTVVPALKFVGVVGILLTFCVFNFLLAGAPTRNPADNFAIASVLLHIVCPILYIADWFLFYERKKLKWYVPAAAVLFPVAYVAFILIRAPFVTLDPSNKDIAKYPYFFLNVDDLGWAGVGKWIAILFVGFIAVGYILFAVDRLLGKRKG